MDIFEVLKEYGKFVIPVSCTILLQIVKALLNNRGVTFKNPDNWLWILLLLGLPMAWIDYSTREYVDFTAGGFILLSVVYAALSALVYKIGKVGGKSVKDIFSNKKGPGNG